MKAKSQAGLPPRITRMAADRTARVPTCATAPRSAAALPTLTEVEGLPFMLPARRPALRRRGRACIHARGILGPAKPVCKYAHPTTTHTLLAFSLCSSVPSVVRPLHANFIAICSSRISLTVRATMALPEWVKKRLISVMASCE
jgi:hypothetical protein